MREIGAVKKDKTNQAQGYKYRGIEDFVNACHPIFAKHGVYISTTIDRVSREERPTRSGGVNIYTNLIAKFTFYAEDGSCVSTELPGEAMDNGDKSTNKALSAALKYCLAQMLLIPFDMIDSEIHSPDVVLKEPATRLQQAADKLAEDLNLSILNYGDDIIEAKTEYINLLRVNQKSFSPTEFKKMQPSDLWDLAKYKKGIEYLKYRQQTDYSKIS